MKSRPDLLSLLPPELLGEPGPNGIKLKLKPAKPARRGAGTGAAGELSLFGDTAGMVVPENAGNKSITPRSIRPAAPTPTPQSGRRGADSSSEERAGTTYELRVVNGRVVREGRHPDSEYNQVGVLSASLPLAPEGAPLERRATPRGYVRLSRGKTGPGDPLRELDYVVVDVETTGAGIGHRITEVCIVRMNGNGRVIGEYSTLVNPMRPIPPMITSLTHINGAMVHDAPRFRDIAQDVRQWLDGAVFVAHNASFDWHFISRELLHATGRPLHGRMLCTVRLARRFVPEIPKRSLDALSYLFGLENEARHRAFGDARVTADIFRILLDRIEEHSIEGWDQLQRHLYARAGRKKRSAMPRPMEWVP